MIDDTIHILTVFLIVPTIIFAVFFAFSCFLPISDIGCDNYQTIRGMVTPEGIAIGCEWNGTAWHFNQTLVNLTFHETKEYVI